MTELNYQKLQSSLEKESLRDIEETVKHLRPYLVRYVKNKRSFITSHDVAPAIHSLGLIGGFIAGFSKDDKKQYDNDKDKLYALQGVLSLFSMLISFVRSPVTDNYNVELLATLEYIDEKNIDLIKTLFPNQSTAYTTYQQSVEAIANDLALEIVDQGEIWGSGYTSPEELKQMLNRPEIPTAPEFKDDNLKTVWEDVVNNKEVDVSLLDEIFIFIETRKPRAGLSNAIAEFFIERNLNIESERMRKLSLNYIRMLNSYSIHMDDENPIIAEASLNTLLKRITDEARY